MSYAGMFKGINDAKTTFRGTPMRCAEKEGRKLPTEYELEIDNCQGISTREKGPAFVVTFKVISTDHPDVKPGQERSWFQYLNDTGLGEVKKFVFAVFGIGQAEEERQRELAAKLEGLMDKVVGKEQVFRGKRVRVRVENTLTKKRADFTRHTFAPMS